MQVSAAISLTSAQAFIRSQTVNSNSSGRSIPYRIVRLSWVSRALKGNTLAGFEQADCEIVGDSAFDNAALLIGDRNNFAGTHGFILLCKKFQKRTLYYGFLSVPAARPIVAKESLGIVANSGFFRCTFIATKDNNPYF